MNFEAFHQISFRVNPPHAHLSGMLGPLFSANIAVITWGGSSQPLRKTSPLTSFGVFADPQ